MGLYVNLGALARTGDLDGSEGVNISGAGSGSPESHFNLARLRTRGMLATAREE